MRGQLRSHLLVGIVVVLGVLPGSATPAARLNYSSAQSSNWAGYAAYGTTFTGVSGTWIEPTATCGGSTTAAATWVGLDGYSKGASSSSTVEQIGTDADCAGGSPSYYAWHELYPSGAAMDLPSAQYQVDPGDVVSASVVATAGNFTLTLSDKRDGSSVWQFSDGPTAIASAQGLTAEWIVEAPSLCVGSQCEPVALTNISPVQFSGAEATTSATAGPVNDASWSDDSITLTDRGTMATPSALSTGGSAFTVTVSASSRGGQPGLGGGLPGPGGGGLPPGPHVPRGRHGYPGGGRWPF